MKPFCFGVYVEPFVGGGNMIAQVDAKVRIGADTNEYVIALLEAISNGWVPPERVERETHKAVKCSPEEFPKHFVGWVGFCCSFRGNFFAGFAEDHLRKSGRVESPQTQNRNNVLRQAPLIKGVDFLRSNFLDLQIPKGALVYCDPPYRQTTAYRDKFDHKIFDNWVRDKSKKNVVFVSEYNMPEDFICVWEKKTQNRMGVGSSKKSFATEKLFIHESLGGLL